MTDSLLVIDDGSGGIARVIGGFRELRERATDLSSVFRDAETVARKQWSEEFAQEAGYTAGGQLISWKKTEAFGDIPAPTKTMQRSGRLAGAVGGGAGSVSEIRRDGMTIGISGSAVPYAVVHRGTSNFQVIGADRNSFETIRVTEKMRGFLRANGVFLKKSTTTIKVPRRPFMSWTPQIQTEVTRLLAAYVISGRAEVAA